MIAKVRSDGRKRVNEAQFEDNTSSEDGIKALTLVHMQGPIFLYLVCIFVSVATFLREVVSKLCNLADYMKQSF